MVYNARWYDKLPEGHMEQTSVLDIRIKNLRKIQKYIQKQSKNYQQWVPKTIQNGPKMDLLGPLGGLLVLGGILEAVLGRLGGVLVANMAPTWPPKRSPNRSKIEAKINQFLNASWDRIFEG